MDILGFGWVGTVKRRNYVRRPRFTWVGHRYFLAAACRGRTLDVVVVMTPTRRADADEMGTALAELLPWLHSIDDLVGAAQHSLDRAPWDEELARALEKYRETARAFLGEADQPEPVRDWGTAHADGYE